MFDGPHLHLALNHFPVIGFPLILILTLTALLLKNSTLKLSSFFSAILISTLAYLAFQTGEIADDKIKDLRPLSEQFIVNHEEAAEKIIWLAGISGFIGLIGVITYRRKKKISEPIFILFIVSLILSSLGMIWVANLGGQISHPEIRKKIEIIDLNSACNLQDNCDEQKQKN